LSFYLGLGYSGKAAQQADIRGILAFISALAAEYEIAQFAVLAAPQKAQAAAFLPALAQVLAAELKLLSKEQLAAQAGRCISHSARSMALYGCGSVAEAAALAAGGAGAKLLMLRHICGSCTLAIAKGES